MSPRTRRKSSPFPLSPTKATLRSGSVGIGPGAPWACSRTGPRAMARSTRIPPTLRVRWRLFIAERLDRVEARCFARRVEPEEDADRGGEAKGQHDRVRRHQRPPLRDIANRARAGD